MKTHIQVLVASIMVLSAVQSLVADDASTPTATKHKQAEQPFLGVAVTSVHAALSNNLPDLLSAEQGLIVEDLADDSPAAKAGIKVHDILTTYDDQKLFSTEQLAKLVHSDRPGHEVAIGYLRNGKLEKTKVKLGEAESPRAASWTPFEGFPHPYASGGRTMRRMHGDETPISEWETFDSMSLKKLGENKFRAEVAYLDKDGKTRKHVFEGTREEIRKSIREEKDLKPIERHHLLRSLNLRSLDDELPFPNVWFGPRSRWYSDPFDVSL